MGNVLVTGGAGFIGSHLCDALVLKGHNVVCLDNMQRGMLDNIRHLMDNENFAFHQVDARNQSSLEELIRECKIEKVYHLAANTDLWESMKQPEIEHEYTFETTRSVLNAMKNQDVHELFFASTSAIYGEQKKDGFSENDLLKPISYYGAAKMAAEAYIHAYSYMNDIKVVMYRFSNIIGDRMDHGVIPDFIKRLLKDPTHLDVRGNGYQTKPYLHVSELIRAIMMPLACNDNVNIYNVGATTYTNVRFIANAVIKELGLDGIPIYYENRQGGWKGDVAYYEYNVDRINAEGWTSTMTSDESVLRAVSEIANNIKGRIAFNE